MEAKTYSVGMPEATQGDADLRRDVTFVWEHDGAANAIYPTNPRVKDTTISDDHNNHRHTSVSYQPFTTPTGSTVPQGNSYSATYTNNRLTGSMTNGNAGTSWVYNGEGSLTQSQSRSTSETDTYLYGYDQAGQLVSTLVQRVTTVEQDEATQQSFDGDGRRVMFYDDLNTIDGTNHRLYFVRSTALGGQILDEVNPSGQKQRAYVYAGGSPLATQEGTGSQVRWEHRDPNSAGIYSTDASGALASHGEYDPLGVSAPDVPGLTMVNNSPYNSGSFGTPDMGCNVDRIPTPCTMARRWEASGVPSTTVTYYLRSTVLGGKIVAQYNSAGGRQSSYAWAGGEVLAEQTGADTGAPPRTPSWCCRRAGRTR